jgi:hypothetical protein
VWLKRSRSLILGRVIVRREAATSVGELTVAMEGTCRLWGESSVAAVMAAAVHSRRTLGAAMELRHAAVVDPDVDALEWPRVGGLHALERRDHRAELHVGVVRLLIARPLCRSTTRRTRDGWASHAPPHAAHRARASHGARRR